MFHSRCFWQLNFEFLEPCQSVGLQVASLILIFWLWLNAHRRITWSGKAVDSIVAGDHLWTLGGVPKWVSWWQGRNPEDVYVLFRKLTHLRVQARTEDLSSQHQATTLEFSVRFNEASGTKPKLSKDHEIKFHDGAIWKFSKLLPKYLSDVYVWLTDWLPEPCSYRFQKPKHNKRETNSLESWEVLFECAH